MLLKEAIESPGDLFLGMDVMQREGGWNLLCKFFDNLGPIPHHLHQTDEFAARVGQKGKPEAYYFPPQYNFKDNKQCSAPPSKAWIEFFRVPLLSKLIRRPSVNRKYL